MRAPTKDLFLVITVLLALTSACSSARLPEQRVEAATNKIEASQQPTAVAAIVKATNANVRDKPAKGAAVVVTVHKGDLLSLVSTTAIGPWYQIRDSKTATVGWIHGNTITLLQAAETKPASATETERPRTTSTPITGRSYVNVDGIRVPSPVFSPTKPAGASARCRDGSYSFSQHRSGTCSHHGGVAEWF